MSHLDQYLKARDLLAGATGVMQSLAEREGDNAIGDMLRRYVEKQDAFLKAPIFRDAGSSPTSAGDRQ